MPRRRIDAVSGAGFATATGGDDLSEARDAYVDVVVRRAAAEAFAADHWPSADERARARALELLEAQRWRLAMFASDAWFWDDPLRPETRAVLRAAGRAVRLVGGEVGRDLERRFVDDLSLLTSPSRGLDGAAIYRMALADVGQPPPG